MKKEEVLEISNQILQNNGMTYATNPLQTTQAKPPLKNPTDRALGFDINSVKKDGENLQKKLTKMKGQEFGDSQNIAENLLKELSKYVPAANTGKQDASKLKVSELQL